MWDGKDLEEAAERIMEDIGYLSQKEGDTCAQLVQGMGHLGKQVTKHDSRYSGGVKTELEAAVRREVERIFEEKRHKLGVEARLELGFLDHVPIAGKYVYGEAFPHERPPRVRLEVFAPDATTAEITRTVCEELLHVKHPELSEEEVGRRVPACVEGGEANSEN